MGEKSVYGYIYVIENLLKEKLYIGKTVDLKKRMNRHRNDALKGVNKHLYNAMRKYGLENFIMYVVDEASNSDELSNLERYYISLYNTFLGYGYNNSAGGDGFDKGENHPMYGLKGDKSHNFGKKHTDEWKNNHSKNMMGDKNPFYGKKHTEETKDKLRKANLGKKLSEEHKRKVRENHADVSGDKNGMAKSIVKLSMDGEFVEEYKTVKDGALSVDGDSSTIVKCCKGRQKSSKGYIWMYKYDYEEKVVTTTYENRD